MSTYPLMNVEKQCLTFLNWNVLLKDTRRTAMIQLIVMDEVPFGPAHQELGLSFVIRYRFELKLLRKQFSSVWVRAGQFSHSYYLWYGLPALASWSGRGPRVGIRHWCQAIFIKPNGWLDEVLYEQAQHGMFTTRPV
jgi:hypothetical protein